MIPWDTDIDIFIPHSSVFTFKNSFKQMNVFMDQTDDYTIPTENVANR